ncbi:MAG: dTDP-4-dehydrorhamnose 3,5-epimerase family protein [Actinobacteria bacterium]|nr:dTDP-4-dehydrorhamnose 3,5-epimerase family protein [Actinomycetota bacterium]
MGQASGERETTVPVTGAIPGGVQIRPLAPHRDDRGDFVEIFRDEWDAIARPAQWGHSTSHAGVVRGVHVHPVHDDFLVVVSGRMFAGLVDLRVDSPTHGAAACLELSGDAPAGVTIPHGVAHGFYFAEPSAFVLGVTHTYDPADELGCRWDDPELGIPWPAFAGDPTVSPRDLELQSLSELRRELAALAAV